MEEPRQKIKIPRNVLVLTLSSIIWSMSDTNVDNFLSLYILKLGATERNLGSINALGSFSAMLLYPLGGYIADKSGRVRLVSAATLLYASSFIFYIMAPSWKWAAFAMVYQSMALFYLPALNAIKADSIPVKQRGELYALTFALPNIIKIVSPYVGGQFIARFELIRAMKIGFTLSLLMGLVVSFLRFRYLNETMTEAEGIPRNPLKVFKEGYREMFVSLRWVWDNIRDYAFVSILLSFLGSMILPFWVVYATQKVGLTELQWGAILLWSGVARAIISLFIGKFIDRFGSRVCFLVGFVIAIPTMFLFTHVDSFWSALPVYSLVVVSSVFIWIASQVYLANSIPREIRGRIMAVLGSGMGIGVSGVGFATGFLIFLPRTLGSLVGGYIYGSNAEYPWLVQTVLLTVGLIYTYLKVHDPKEAYE